VSAGRDPDPARRRRSLVLLFALLGFAVLVYLITVAQLSPGAGGAT
jgi:hypothetical protein